MFTFNRHIYNNIIVINVEKYIETNPVFPTQKAHSKIRESNKSLYNYIDMFITVPDTSKEGKILEIESA